MTRELSCVQTKRCRTCGASKPTSLFYKSTGCELGVRPDCIECHNEKRRQRYNASPDLKEKRAFDYTQNSEAAKEYARIWRLQNLERARAKAKENRATNKDKIKQSIAEWRDENPDRIKQYSKEYYAKNREEILEKKRDYRALNNEHVIARDKKYDRTGIDKRRRSTPKGKLSASIQSGIRRGIERGSKSGRRTFELVGYTCEQLKAHLEGLFLPGMTWDNYGEWHIDHIIPLSAFNYTSPDHIDFKRCWALNNLQPLWARDNLRKNARLTVSFQPSLAI